MVQINIQISEEEKKKFDMALAKKGDTKTKVITEAINNYVKVNE